MNNGYIGEIRMFAGNYAPAGWALCEGQLIPISENDALFTLIGTTYGGDGQSTFALPDLRGRLPIGQDPAGSSQTYLLGEAGGAEEVTLSVNQIPFHTHTWTVAANRSGTATIPSGARLAQSTSVTPYVQASPDTALAADAAAPVGGSQPHSNMQPYLCVNFIISLYGEFPSET